MSRFLPSARVSLALLVAASATALSGSAAAADLYVGPVGSGAQYSKINKAIEAAQPGDRILVHAGVYEEIVWVNKPVELIGGLGGGTMIYAPSSPSFPVVTPPPLTVSAIAAGQRARVANVNVVTALEWPPFGVAYVHHCEGRVELVNVNLSVGTTPFDALSNAPAFLWIELCAQVYLANVTTPMPSVTLVPKSGVGLHAVNAIDSNVYAHRCILNGAARASGGTGLRLENSQAELSQCALRGGPATGMVPAQGLGGVAIQLIGSHARIAAGIESLLEGADATEDPTPSTLAGLAGSAIVADIASTLVHAVDVVPIGGAATPSYPSAPPVEPGSSPAVTVLLRRLPVLTFPTKVVVFGNPFTLTIEGEPGAPVARFLSAGSGPAFSVPGIGGTALLDLSTLFVLSFAVLGPTGHASIQGTIGADPALSGLSILEQGLQVLPAALDLSLPAHMMIAL